MSPTQYPSRFRPPSPRSRRRTLTPTPTRPHLRIAKARPISPAYDGNGNVRALVKADAANPAASAVTARYAYDGFGREVAVSGADAGANSFRFSTKQLETETGMNYYGYRFYAANAGRWINRDVIEEKGGINLYSFAKNDGIIKVDFLGQFDPFDPHCYDGVCLPSPYEPPPSQDETKTDSISTPTVPSFTFGQSWSYGYTGPIFPALPLMLVQFSGQATAKTGTCCKDGKKKTYNSISGSVTGGAGAGVSGNFKFDVSKPLIENLAECPTEETKTGGTLYVQVRIGPVAGQCDYFDNSWSCSGSISYRLDQLKNGYVTAGGGISVSKTKVE